ncbi:hypothetical protein L596_002208 [Steinernema carpocapsae]|uniref:Uncharacterized protein n=1 Tax=Steinernema carpocapsae TaxID=34508 RepID=A0A4U8UR81_STECR|nr:hypothetical protein L596_002208 [Steinernema carpocapsae]
MGVNKALLFLGGLLVALLSVQTGATSPSPDAELQQASSSTPEEAKAGTFCEDYSICLLKLEGKQRECLAQGEKRPLVNATFSTHGINYQLINECGVKKRKLRHDIRVLQHRKTEITRDCVSKNIGLAESVLDPVQEDKCRDAKKAVEKFTVPAKDVVKTGGEQLFRARRGAGPATPEKRDHHCHHHVAQLDRKCHILARCCSTSTECSLDAAKVHDQIDDLKHELQKIRAQCDPQVDHEIMSFL